MAETNLGDGRPLRPGERADRLLKFKRRTAKDKVSRKYALLSTYFPLRTLNFELVRWGFCVDSSHPARGPGGDPGGAGRVGRPGVAVAAQDLGSGARGVHRPRSAEVCGLLRPDLRSADLPGNEPAATLLLSPGHRLRGVQIGR